MAHRTSQEKLLIVHAHRYFLAEARQRLSPLGRAVRQRVAECLAVSEDLVARVVAAYNKHGEADLEAPPSKRGCPPRSHVQDLHGYITDIIRDRNLSKRRGTSAPKY
ncbi:uncharacterized protein PITG_17761 [Phytophthora infestans T30-4]|uniref:Uncharacterized protein n=1 Tax=Phytophthora infestans (strain T30-4) TaxID=403677 RepID=D0NW78_PHYIT|nr:uncharacterized protein PITG_17761 [Phytophthora infestans T30-4]EEY66895.1 hypothetical protein PITG_17761 [Phytophthora infestans T30-4]|eukprot:XP_002896613.1 hypothetical protein PITG_17761 [Phytophthora infestans T30-4]